MSCNFELLSIIYLGLLLGALVLLNTSYFLSDKKTYFCEQKSLEQHGVGKGNIKPPNQTGIISITNSQRLSLA